MNDFRFFVMLILAGLVAGMIGLSVDTKRIHQQLTKHETMIEEVLK